MRLAAIVLALLTVAASPTPLGRAVRPAAGKPMRVMSINQCTDQLVLALLPPERIASVTWLSRDADASLMVGQAGRVGVNHGFVEEVLRQKPDLVIAGTGAKPATRAMLRRIGYPLLEVDDAYDFAQIRRVTRQVGRAVGEPARGEALIARMDRRLADLARDRRPPIRVAAWSGDGFSAPRGSLYDTVLHAAGAINVGGEPPASRYGVADTEILLASAPTLLVQATPTGEGPALRDNLAFHPLVRRYWGRDRTVMIRQSSYMCGTPLIADAVIALRDRLRRAADTARTPLPFVSGRPR